MSDTKRYRKFSAQQKTEIVLASLRGNKTHAELCREHDIADSLLRKCREQFLAAGAERLGGKTERTEADELRQRVTKLERALGRKTMEVEIARKLLRDGSARTRSRQRRTTSRGPIGLRQSAPFGEGWAAPRERRHRYLLALAHGPGAALRRRRPRAHESAQNY